MSGRKILLAVLAVVSVLALSACGASASRPRVPAPSTTPVPCATLGGFTGSVNDHGTVAGGGGAVSLNAGDYFFSPTCETGLAAGTVVVTVKNTGHALHSFTISDQNVDIDIAAGETRQIQVTLTSGPLQYVCKYHRTSGMVGALLPAGKG